MKPYKSLAVAICPAFFVGVIYELFLGHRHDYSGHYAAGYGGTFAAAMFLLRILEPSELRQRATRYVVPFCIAGGAIAEATAFRIAKFDEIGFFNQSLGAVLATICASFYIEPEMGSEARYNSGMIVGIAFLGAGGCLAVA